MRRVVVDTSVWSLFLRRKKLSDGRAVTRLKVAIEENRVQMLGIIRQELLTGIQSAEQFARLEKSLEAFPDLLAERADHVLAAKFYNVCRARGVQGSLVDFLICAQAVRWQMPVLTTDRDFEKYAKFIPVELE